MWRCVDIQEATDYLCFAQDAERWALPVKARTSTVLRYILEDWMEMLEDHRS